ARLGGLVLLRAHGLVGRRRGSLCRPVGAPERPVRAKRPARLPAGRLQQPRARERDAGFTVGGQIDGWRKEKVDPMRIDFVFAGQPGPTHRSRVIFNGDFYPVISDHYGVLTEEGECTSGPPAKAGGPDAFGGFICAAS